MIFFEGGMCRYKHFPVYCTTTDKTNEKSSQWQRGVEHNSHNPCHKSPFLTPVIFSCILLWWHHRNFIDTKLLWNPQRRPGLWWAQRTLAWYWSGFYYPLFFFSFILFIRALGSQSQPRKPILPGSVEGLEKNMMQKWMYLCFKNIFFMEQIKF